MIVSLNIIAGEDQGAEFHVAEGEAKLLGRSARCDLKLRDASISRQHARLRMQDGVCWILDLGSRNGIIVNGKPIRGEVRLNNQDLIDLGVIRAIVRVQADFTSESATPPPPPLYEAPPIAHSTYGSETITQSGFKIQLTPEEYKGRKTGGCLVEQFLWQDDLCMAFLARQLSMDRSVTLLLLLPNLANDETAIERFLAAARLGGKLSHPNIIQVYDAGLDGDGYFIALEHVGGNTIRKLLNEQGRNMPLLQAVEIAEQIAGALDHAHVQSIVHGHVSPETLYLTPHGIPKLAGVGLLGMTADERARARTLYDLSFLAPEQLEEPANAAAAPADIYALGAVLHAMLTGQAPFQASDTTTLVRKAVNGEREPLLRLRRDAPKELAAVVDRAMAPRPGERFERAAEMQAALLKALELLRY